MKGQESRRPRHGAGVKRAGRLLRGVHHELHGDAHFGVGAVGDVVLANFLDGFRHRDAALVHVEAQLVERIGNVLVRDRTVDLAFA